MVIFVEFPPRTTTTGSFFQARELCCYRLRQDIPTTPKTSTVPAKAITCRCPESKVERFFSLKCVKFPPSLIMWCWVEPGGYSLSALRFNIRAFSMQHIGSHREIGSTADPKNLGYSIPGSLSSVVT